jgi:hypothetical protein
MAKSELWPVSRQEKWLVDVSDDYCKKEGINKSILTRLALVDYLLAKGVIISNYEADINRGDLEPGSSPKA